MSRRVKCCLSGAQGTSDTFYRAPNGRYYQTQALYDAAQRKTAIHKQILETLLDAMSYQKGMVFPTSLPRRLKEFDFYGEDVLLETIRRCTPAIREAVQTHYFATEYQKISYVAAILKNKINDVYKDFQCREKAQAAASSNRTLCAYEDNYEELDAVQKHRKPPKRDISRWLGGDDVSL